VSPPEDTDSYLGEHVRQALATDERVNEPELDVVVEVGRIIVIGVVPTEERRSAVSDVVRDCCPDLEVENRTTVADHRRSQEPERLS
jgi:hypothetical protein